jgi:transcriptional regulator with XRE-family HTH domain
MPLDTKTLGVRIGQMRELQGLSLGVLAERADGLAKSYLAKLERGEVENPGLRTLTAIARALGVTVGDLITPIDHTSSAAKSIVAEKHAEYEHTLENLPLGLGDFLDLMKQDGKPVPPSTVRALATVEFRGRRPERIDDWKFLYEALVRSVGKS